MNNDSDNGTRHRNKMQETNPLPEQGIVKKALKGFKFPFKQCAIKLMSYLGKLYSALTSLNP